jgi:hypothetical protein
MMRKYPAARNALRYANTTLAVNTDGATVGKRMLEVARGAILRCTHGASTLPTSRFSLSTPAEAVFDLLWPAFADADAITTAGPQCFLRGRPRVPCADVGVAAAGDRENSNRSLVQLLYEQQWLDVKGEALAQLYYDYTPGLPAEARGWRAAASRMNVSLHTNGDALGRTVPVISTADDDVNVGGRGGGTDAISSVILFLAGTADRNPSGRNGDFTQHALPLLERNFLRAYLYHPVHVFYEAPAPAPASGGWVSGWGTAGTAWT